MTNLVKATDETGYRARADRSLQSGRVVLVDRTTNTAILDVGMVDNNGNGVYMHDVPFSPQSPPHPNDTVAILRTSSSPYSHVVGSGAQVGGGNSGQVVTAGGAVSSIAKSGSTALQGPVTLSATGGASLNQSAQDIGISGGLPTGGSTGQALVKASGTDYDVEWTTTGTAAATAGAATSNTQRGTITSEALTTAAGSDWVLTLTNSKVSATSIVLATVDNGSNTTEGVAINRVTPGSGSVVIRVRNTHSASALNGTVKVNFAVL